MPSDGLIIDEAKQYMSWVRNHPIDHAHIALGFEPWRDQKNVLEAFADPSINRIAWRSGNGVGKTYLTANLIINYLDTHNPGYVIVSGSSWTGILKTIWPTLRKVLREAPVRFGGHLLSSEWRRGDMWGAFCVSPDEPENYGGFRTENGALVIVDESSALDYKSLEAIQGLCSAAGSKIVLFGNPLRPEGPFFDAFLNEDRWTCFSSSSLDAADAGIPGLATHEWCEAMAEEYGESSNVYKSRVLGEFPESGDHEVVPRGWGKRIRGEAEPAGKRRLGVDVARFGGDRTVFLIRDDTGIRYLREFQGIDTMETAGWAVAIMKQENVQPYETYVDVNGIGGGVVDRLNELGLDVNGVNFGAGAIENDRFKNERAECYWNMRDALHPDEGGRLKISEGHKALISELHIPHYAYTSKGQIKIESKDEIKKRLGRSPDIADALALTFSGKNVEEFIV